MTESILRPVVAGDLHLIPAAVFDPVRLAAVAETRLLDTGPEPSFDDLGRLAADFTGANRVLITVVDARRSFWKSVIGADIPAIEDRQNPVQESFCQIVIGTGREFIAEDAATDPRVEEFPPVAAWRARMNIGAYAGYPVHGLDGQILGVFCVIDDEPREWTPRQRRGLAALARAVSSDIGLRQALGRSEIKVTSLQTSGVASQALARTLQDSLLPPVIACPPGIDTAAVYLPASGGPQVVGDFYDLFPTPDQCWYAVLGDVCGKGIEAAKVTALARYTIRTEATQHSSPVIVLNRLNQALLAQRISEKFLTCVSVSFKIEGTSLVGLVCTAGHPPALLRRADGTVEQIGRPALALGIFDDTQLAADHLRMGPGDALLLYTDGVTEAHPKNGGTWFEEQDLIQTLAGCHDLSAEQITDRIISTVLHHTRGHTSDDIALLVLRIPS